MGTTIVSPGPIEMHEAFGGLASEGKTTSRMTSTDAATARFRQFSNIPALRGLRDHPDPRVRYAVVFGLSGIDDDLAVDTLIELSADVDPHVRDWATFGLGTQIDRDDPAVRDALMARLEDPDKETRGEAIRGLATRGDTRAIPQLLHELNRITEHPGLSVIDACSHASSRSG